MIADWLKRIKHINSHKVAVLMYHRIANLQTDPWGLAVKPQNVEQHLQVLKKNYNVIPISELVIQLHNKKINTNSVCITFDDAYTDNYLYAKPLLQQYKLPVTFFVPTLYINRQELYWWDELANILLTPQALPTTLSIRLGNEWYKYQLANQEQSQAELQKQYAWRWPNDPPTQRCKLYLEIWGKLKLLTFTDIDLAVKKIKDWAKLPSISDRSFPMNSRRLQEMIDESLFEVGAHTVTHGALSNQSYETQKKEIIESRNFLQDLSNQNINTIAYPYGAFNKQTIKIVKDENLIGFTTQPKIITKSSDNSKLGRFQVEDWNGETFERKLASWFR